MPAAQDEASIRVLLVDDHRIVREGLRSLLEERSDIEVVGEVGDGKSAIDACSRLRPHVVVMDLSLPGMDGVETTKRLCEQDEQVRVLVLSMYSGEDYVRPALRAGAKGYLLKGSGLSDLVAAIEAIMRGDAFFSPEVAKILLDESRSDEQKKKRKGVTEDGNEIQLTAREQEILLLVGEGKSSPEIAESLGLSVKTVEGHRSRVMSKLGVKNVAGLVRQAIRLGFVKA